MYKISKEIAQLIGRFEYKPNHFFSPFECEQIDGDYLIGVKIVEELKDNENIQKVDWSKQQIINSNDIKTKVINLPNF